MADDEIQKEPPQAEARPLEDDRFRQPGPARNWMARIAFWLAVLSLIPLVTCMTAPWGLVNRNEQIAIPAGLSPEDADKEGKRQQQGYKRRIELAASVLNWCIFLECVLGPVALIFGILGARYWRRHPTAGGLGFAIVGIMMGLPISLLCLCLLGLWAGILKIGFAGWK